MFLQLIRGKRVTFTVLRSSTPLNLDEFSVPDHPSIRRFITGKYQLLNCDFGKG